MTVRLDARVDEDVVLAARMLRDGKLVAVPTETVYGLGADASNDGAVARIFTVKGRPRAHPLILHVSDIDAARRVASHWTNLADILAHSFWPGALSILVDKAPNASDVVTGSRPTVVVRVPGHPATRRIIELMHADGSVGLAAPSANKFGAVSPTTADHVLFDLKELIDAVLDGGPCAVGVESTIVDCTGVEAVVLRDGGVPYEDIANELALHGLHIRRSSDMVGTTDSARAIAPGMLMSHYAPRARVEVFESSETLHARRRDLDDARITYAELAHPVNLFEYSRGLYASMRECDSRGVEVILAVLPEPTGLGIAIRDRLSKAAAQR